MKGIFIMAKEKSIKYMMKTELNKMQAYGRSKHADQVKTREERSNLKAQGIPYSEYKEIDYTREHIYSHNAMKTYQHEIDRFADYLKKHDMNKITMEQAKTHVQEYLDYLKEERNLSAQSIHTSCAALSKVFHTTMWDYNKPTRSVAQIERGKHTYKNLNEKEQLDKLRENPIWNANSILGMRKNELINLRADMIKERDNRVIIEYIGKGGKHNVQSFYDNKEKSYILSLKNGKTEHERIFDKQEVKQALNLHKAREIRCKEVYNRVLDDINKRGKEAEKEYIQQIELAFQEAGKTLRENLHSAYYVRGSNRERLENENRPVEYNRIALMVVSTQITQHFRSNVTANYYVGK